MDGHYRLQILNKDIVYIQGANFGVEYTCGSIKNSIDEITPNKPWITQFEVKYDEAPLQLHIQLKSRAILKNSFEIKLYEGLGLLLR